MAVSHAPLPACTFEPISFVGSTCHRTSDIRTVLCNLLQKDGTNQVSHQPHSMACSSAMNAHFDSLFHLSSPDAVHDSCWPDSEYGMLRRTKSEGTPRKALFGLNRDVSRSRSSQSSDKNVFQSSTALHDVGGIKTQESISGGLDIDNSPASMFSSHCRTVNFKQRKFHNAEVGLLLHMDSISNTRGASSSEDMWDWLLQ